MAEKKKPNRKKDEKRKQISFDDPSSDELKTGDQPYFDPNETKNKLRYYFLIILISGSLLILVAPFQPLVQILLASVLMLIYWMLGRAFSNSPVTRAVFADSIYYLGFLFTFVALIAAMVSLDGEIDIQKIIGQMGPALVTTVLGMAARIYLTQFEPITSEPETETFNALGTLSSNLIKALDTLKDNSEQNFKALEDFQKKTSTQMQDFAKKLNDIDTKKTYDNFNKLAESINALTIASKNLNETSNRTKFVVEEVKDKFSDLENTITDTKKKLRQSEDFSNDLKQLNNNVEQSKEVFKSITSKMETRVNIAASKVAQSVNKIEKDLDTTQEQTKKYSKTIQKSVNDVLDFLNSK